MKSAEQVCNIYVRVQMWKAFTSTLFQLESTAGLRPQYCQESILDHIYESESAVSALSMDVIARLGASKCEWILTILRHCYSPIQVL